jgi:hypothetical protein
MSATLGKNPVPTGSAAAYQVTVHSLTNVHSTCPWYIKCKLGYNKKQKSKAIKQAANAIKFDEVFYYERWDLKEILQLSVWKEKNKLKHVAVANLDLQCPSSKQYPSCMYEIKTELFPLGSKAGEDGMSPRARANTALEGEGVDASKPCGEITITVKHVPGYTRWQQLQEAGGASSGEALASDSKVDHSDSQQSKKAELMKAAAEHKAEKDKVADVAKSETKEAVKPAEEHKPTEEHKPAEPDVKPTEPIKAAEVDAKPTEQAKPMEQTKPAEADAKPAEADAKPAESTSNPEPAQDS